jgi:ABC-type transport system involved in multi-copper enzyme maturation permease subunit
MARARQFLALSAATTAETVRQPVLLLLTSLCVLVSALVPSLKLFQLGEEGKLARDSSLSLHFLVGFFITCYAACTALSNELRDDTADAVLSKPVSREVFFLAKFAGVAVVVLLFSMAAGITTLLSERAAERFVAGPNGAGIVMDARAAAVPVVAVILSYAAGAVVNYKRNRYFGASAFVLLPLFLIAGALILAFFDRSGNFSAFSFRFDWRLVSATALIVMALLMAGAMALAVSARLGTASTLLFVAVLFSLGLVSDYLFAYAAEPWMPLELIYRLVPNWQHFWRADALTGNGQIRFQYVCSAGFYALMYTVGCLCAGVLLFRGRDLR